MNSNSYDPNQAFGAAGTQRQQPPQQQQSPGYYSNYNPSYGSPQLYTNKQQTTPSSSAGSQQQQANRYDSHHSHNPHSNSSSTNISSSQHPQITTLVVPDSISRGLMPTTSHNGSSTLPIGLTAAPRALTFWPCPPTQRKAQTRSRLFRGSRPPR